MDTQGFHGLVAQAQGGDRRAMDQVLSLLGPYLEHMARAYADPLKPSESTSDLLQDSCLKAWEGLGSFEGGKNDEQTFAMFRAWLGQIIRRQGINALRNRRRQRRSPSKKVFRLDTQGTITSKTSQGNLEPPSPDLTPAASFRSAERMRSIETAVQQLPDETSATIVRLHVFQGLTLVDIAKKLGLHYEKVRRRYRAAVRQLKEDLEEWF